MLNTIIRLYKAIIAVFNTPESFYKGEEFETYVKSLINKEEWNIIHQTNSYQNNKDGYTENTLMPDFLIQHKKTYKRIYLECKYRSKISGKYLLQLPEKQFMRYQDSNEEYPVFLIIGIEGKPVKPKNLYLYPLKYQNIYPDKKNKIIPGPLSINHFKKLINDSDTWYASI